MKANDEASILEVIRRNVGDDGMICRRTDRTDTKGLIDPEAAGYM